MTVAPAAQTEAPQMAALNVTDVTNRGVVTGTAVVSSTVALFSTSAAGLAGSLLITTEECKIYGDTKHYPRALHPTQLKIAGLEAAGMVVGNLALALTFFAGHAVVCEVARLVQGGAQARNADGARGRHPEHARLGFPGLPAMVFFILFQGSSVGSLQLLYSSETSTMRMIGCFAVMLCLAMPVAIFVALMKAPVHSTVVKDPRTAGFGKWKRRVLHFVIGEGEWVYLSPVMWTLRYSAVIRSYRLGCLWYHFLQYASMFAVAAIQAFTPTSYIACGHIKLASFCVIFIMLVVLVKAKPYARRRDLIIDGTVMTFQCVALIFMAVGYYREKPQDLLFQGATVLLVLGIVCILVKMFLSLVSELYVFCTGRRSYLQGIARHLLKDTDLESLVASDEALSDEDVGMDAGVELLRLPPKQRRGRPPSHHTLSDTLLPRDDTSNYAMSDAGSEFSALNVTIGRTESNLSREGAVSPAILPLSLAKTTSSLSNRGLTRPPVSGSPAPIGLADTPMEDALGGGRRRAPSHTLASTHAGSSSDVRDVMGRGRRRRSSLVAFERTTSGLIRTPDTIARGISFST